MANMTKDDVLKKAEELGIKFIRLQFTDIFGTVKNVEITVEQLPKALDGELMFDGSSIEGFVRIEESDMYLKPDPATFTILPWTVHEGTPIAGRLICDVYTADNQPFEGCPRCALKKVIAEAEEMGYSMNAGPEPEFFLFQKDEKGFPTTKTFDKGGYFDLSPIDLGEEARRDMVLALKEMGFEIEAAHHEVAQGQHEIDFKYADALTTADNIVTFKFVVRAIALKLGLHAAFMPKPIFGIAGNGMHIHQSLFKGEQNIFFDVDAPSQLSQTALYYIGGILKHAEGITPITNPLVNSYKRLVPDFEAPVYIAWSERNRSPLIRIPARRGVGTRIEIRNPDPACNPYLALAVTLKAGLEGIRNKIEPPIPVSGNIYQMSEEELKKHYIRKLPSDLGQAMEAMQKDELIREALGDHTYYRFLNAKELEWKDYLTQVHQWEINEYLAKV